MDEKTKIFGFAMFIEICPKNISHKDFDQFQLLRKCEVNDDVVVVVEQARG